MKYFLIVLLAFVLFPLPQLEADFSLEDPAASAMQPLDAVLEGGMVFTGDGSPGFIADVGIRGERIEVLGNLSDKLTFLRIDVSGAAVVPGYVDIDGNAVIDERGRIEEGAIANITVLDVGQVPDLVTLQNFTGFLPGVRYVFINGQVVILDEE
jgi:N-acyl-D-aspartate/D-glutamate deacylase